MTDLPLLGAAMPTATLETLQDFILSENRDLEIQDFCDGDLLNGDWKTVADHTRNLLTGYTGRLGIHGPFWGFTIHSKDPEVRAVVAKRMDQALDVCDAVGATQMVIHSPYTTWDHNNFDNNEDARATLIENTHATIGGVVKRAEDQGVVLVIENIEDVDPIDRRHLANSFDSDAIRLSIDTGHAFYAHTCNGAPPVDYYVKSAGEMLNHVHLQDADGYADRHWAIGEGKIRWHSIFRALEKLEVRPRLLLELRDTAGIPASMEFIQREGLGQ